MIIRLLIVGVFFWTKFCYGDDGDIFSVPEELKEDVKLLPDDDGFILNMNEGLEKDTVFLNVLVDDADLKIQYLDPQNNTLQIDNKKNGDKWDLSLGIKPDFEQLDDHQYVISVNSIALTINIININNKEPYIKEFTNPCEIPENEIVTESGCTYVVIDDDGWFEPDKVKFYMSQNNDYFDFKWEQKDKEVTFKLITREKLDYELIPLFTFEWTVNDGKFNTTTSLNIVVRVKDMPDQPPIWIKTFASQELDEMQKATYEVKAKDGDLMIDAEINYKIACKDNIPVTIDEKTGEILVNAIDRDKFDQEIFQCTITAYEAKDELSSITQDVSFVVKDINNQIPVIQFSKGDKTVDALSFEIEESTRAQLPSDYKIEVSDRDTGDNAKFEVKLEDKSNGEYTKAFQIIPTTGYQTWSFSLAIVDNSLLDYENDDWQEFEFELVSIETKDPTHTDRKTMHIKLIDWNDELPVFNEESYTANVQETIEANKEIIKVLATDRDKDTILTYELVGSYKSKLSIASTGDQSEAVITTAVENAFDYETLETVIVRIKATEKDTKEQQSSTVELTINVEDVNDETPKITIQNGIFTVPENQKDGTEIQIPIEATDADKDGILVAEINWDKSYFTKNRVQASPEVMQQYSECVKVQVDKENSNAVKLQLLIAEKVENNTPDFELFDTMYISLIVTDTKQTVGTTSVEALVAISVEDLNDNFPEFIQETIDSKKVVKEESAENDIISVVTAIDRDGEKYNSVTYSLKPKDNTPEGWVKIDEKSGQLKVDKDKAIIADAPDGYDELRYDVTATDGENPTTKEIVIQVLDINNKPPEIEPPADVHIDEKSSEGTKVQTIKATDGDRDEPNNKLRYALDDDSKDIFKIDSGNGDITVGPAGHEMLDRDNGQPTYIVSGKVTDMDGESTGFPKTFSFKVILDDINDQPPKVEDATSTIRQDLDKGEAIVSIKVTDNDEVGTDNSKVELSVIEIIPLNGAKPPPTTLFVVEEGAKQSPASFEIRTGEDLECCYGEFNVVLQAKDHGGKPLQSKNAILQVTIDKYNFYDPTFTYPEDDKHLFILSKTQQIGVQVNCYEEGCIKNFAATDNQDMKYTIDFSIDPDTNKENIFGLKKISSSQTQLILNNEDFVVFQNYELKIVATINGEPQTDAVRNIVVEFISENPTPAFEPEDRTKTLDVHEVEDVAKEFVLPNATYKFDYPGITDDVFYQIKEVTPDKYAKSFELVNSKTNILKLVSELDRETDDVVTVLIVTTKLENGITDFDDEAKMTVTINIIDDNDNPPKFEQDDYSGAIMTSYEIKHLIVTIIASDPDINDKLTWKSGGFTIDGNNLEEVKDPFSLDNGAIRLNFEVKPTMSGVFNYKAIVTDSVHEISTTVKIYIVNDDNRIELKFENTLEEIEPKRNQIVKILTDITGYECNIESINKATDENGNQVDSQSSVLLFFLDPESHAPVKKDVMQAKLTVLSTYNKLKDALAKESLNLMSLGDEKPVDDNTEDVLKAWLIGVSVGLGSLCIILVVVFAIKLRSLSTRLNKLTVTKFGSQESGLNRIAAPGTNMRSAEGANPIFNNNTTEHPEIDRLSTKSDDSGLIGVENNDVFNTIESSKRESVSPNLFRGLEEDDF